MVLAEFNTHRMFSRNSASSRAIPVEKQLAKVRENPFIPIHWGKNQKGMQAEVELTLEEQERAKEAWLKARDYAVIQAEALLEIGVHKQITNRVLEPYMWHTCICTATEWSNYFHLRHNLMAQPEIHCIAEMMDNDYANSTPQQLDYGQWHLPYVRPEEHAELSLEQLIKLSAARCARVSYLTQDGVRDNEADYTLYNRLLQGGHMSPYEHPARPMTEAEIADYKLVKDVNSGSGEPPFLGNFKGWIQHRKEIKGEEDMQAPKG
jgi:thymidylate synthase ThyX